MGRGGGWGESGGAELGLSVTRESERGGRGAGCGNGGGGGGRQRDGGRWVRCGGDTAAVSALHLEDGQGKKKRGVSEVYIEL